MKTIVALCAIAALSAGCSSIPTQKAENVSTLSCDWEQMTRIERANRLRAELHWINCPQLASRAQART